MIKNYGDIQMTTRNVYFWLVLFLAAALITAAAPAFAEEKPIHPGYPFVFHVKGKLDRIAPGENQIVIDDALFNLTESTTYHSFDDSFATSKSFSLGDRVGLIFQNREKREKVESVWLIEKHKKADN